MLVPRKSPPAVLALILTVVLTVAAAACSGQSTADARGSGSTAAVGSSTSAAADMGDSLKDLIEAMAMPYPEGDPRYLSSNPYDYTKENPAFDAVVAMGYEALPGLEGKLRTERPDGLDGYLICVAIETITRCDLKQFEEFTWAHAGGFLAQWEEYLERMPSLVEEILERDLCMKVQGGEIAKLGAPVVPYVVEYADMLDGQYGSEIPGILSTVLLESKPTTTVAEFRDLNREAIDELRAYIEDR